MVLHKVYEMLIGPYRERGTYNNRRERILAFLGSTVGLGNFWRFSYLCCRYGAATFLVPFFILLLVVGIPMFFLEMTLGQYLSWGPIHVFTNLSPMFSGIGWAMVIMNAMVAIYHNLIIAWILSYIPPLFDEAKPWSKYNPPLNCTSLEESQNRFSSAQNYFLYEIFEKPCEEGHENDINWKLLGWYAVAWILVCVGIAKGVRYTGRILYITVGLPYGIMVILLSTYSKNDVTIDLEVNVTELQSYNVWVEAGMQVIFTLGVAHGGIITLASYNTLHQNILRDALMIILLDTTTSLLSGSLVLTFMKDIFCNLPREKKVSSFLVLSIFPALFSNSDSHPLLLICMIFFLGVDSQFVLVETLTTALFDQFHVLRRSCLPVVIATCFLLFLLGIPMCTRGGLWYFEFLEQHVSGGPFIFVGFMEVFVVCHIFGYRRIMKIIKEELRLWIPSPVYYYFLITWMLVTPLSLLALLIYCVSKYFSVHENDFGLLPIIIIVAAIRTIISKGSLSSECLEATEDFCPEYVRRDRKKSQVQLQDLLRSRTLTIKDTSIDITNAPNRTTAAGEVPAPQSTIVSNVSPSPECIPGSAPMPKHSVGIATAPADSRSNTDPSNSSVPSPDVQSNVRRLRRSRKCTVQFTVEL